MSRKKGISAVLLGVFLLTFIFGASPAWAEENTYSFNQGQAENEMLNYINQERQKEGLAPLKMAVQLVDIARLKSQDMVDKNYFAHNSPTYGSPFDMMKKFGVTYDIAGENLAGNGSVLGAHNALMNSTGHRQNILNPKFTHIGIGIVKGGPYGSMYTQLFVGNPQFSEQAAGDSNNSGSANSNQGNDWSGFLLDLINTERQKLGLPKVVENKELTRAAQMKAGEMVEKNYLSHKSPTYGYIDEMLKKLNIPFAEVKENIVASPDVKMAHDALMKSIRHKEVILNPNFTEIGVAVQAGGQYGFNIVEVFIKPQQTTTQPQPEPQPQPAPPKPELEPQPVPEPQPDPQSGEAQLEQQMAALINKDRMQNGLSSLTLNEKLTEIARIKAKDMESNQYLSYTSPTYGRTSDMLNKAGIAYTVLAESIVAASSVEPAHKALMATAKHKGNILNPSVQQMGIGIVKSSRYGYIMVEVFLGHSNSPAAPSPDSEEPKTGAEGLTNQEKMELQMLGLINKARQEAGVSPLTMETKIVKVARLKSQDMIDKNYFAHTSPTYGSPFDMMEQFGINYRTAGENLAGHYSVTGAHEALMNSAGHRRNILNPNYTHIGIGIVEGGPYGIMFTQMFVGY
ncbi:MAG: CAP domain-containing protein [Bacillota bacterium]